MVSPQRCASPGSNGRIARCWTCHCAAKKPLPAKQFVPVQLVGAWSKVQRLMTEEQLTVEGSKEDGLGDDPALGEVGRGSMAAVTPKSASMT